MSNNKYNGWTNWETWNFNLWVTNDESDYEYAMHLASNSDDVHELRNLLEGWAEEWVDSCFTSSEYTHGFVKDMVYSSIKMVNFYEVAEHLLDDMEDK